jgi:opacity protein-like surface antigen
MRPLILLLLGAFAASSQPFSAGVKLGAPFTDFVNTVESGSLRATSGTSRYIVGVTGELHLPLSLSIEADVLYRHFNYQVPANALQGLTGGSGSSGAWEFPILAKYKFPSKIVRPYVDGGVAWNTLQGLASNIVGSSEVKNSTTTGIVLGAGLEIKALVIKVSPEIRYTRWTDQHFTAASLLQSNQNQAEFLVGITF